MQDSSTNPYIPQESEAIRQKTETIHSPLGRIAKILLIVTIVLSVLIAIGLFFVVPRTAYDDKDARIELGNVLQPSDQLAKLVPVTSTQGFSVSYDNQLFTSYAETVVPVGKDGKPQEAVPYYENNDLRVKRDYNLVRVSPVESTDSTRAAVTNPPQLLITANVTAEQIKEAAAKPDFKGLSNLSTFIKLSTDKRLAERTADDGTRATVSIEASKPVPQSINGVEFQKIRYTTKNDNYRIATEKYDDCYYTIQNDQAYAACITNVRPYNVDAAALDEQMLQSLTFQKTNTAADDTDAAANTTTEEQTSEVVDETEAALVTKKAEYNENTESLRSIAKAQPSVVRIGTLYCADLDLKLESGETATTLTNACIGNVANGTIVSSEGHIATSGHAIRHDVKDAINGYINYADSREDLLTRLQTILDYLLKARVILEDDANYLKNGAINGDQEAIAKIENIGSIIPSSYITAVKDEYTYSIQPTNKPIVINRGGGSKPSFAYSDTVLSAKFVAAEYDMSKSRQEVFNSDTPSADVGLLKVEGATFQNTAIAPGNDIKANTVLNTIGFPAYADSALIIDKINNFPQVTNAKVNQTYDRDGERLIETSTPVVPGGDGAGTFDQSGKLVGFAVYGKLYCPDQECFANGTVRSTNELTKLVDDKNIKLGELSQATNTWNRAIDEYFAGNYSAAQSSFATAASQYGFNQWATPLSQLAQSKRGSVGDTSLFNQGLTAMIILLVLMIILTILFAVVFYLQRRRYSMLQVGHYGAMPSMPAANYQPSPQQPPVSSQYQATTSQYQTAPQPVMSTQQPQNQPYTPQQIRQQPQQPAQYTAPVPSGFQPQYQADPTQPQRYEQQIPPVAQPYNAPQSVQPQQPTQPPQSEDPFYRQ
ncbi:hypothetical protein A3C39_04370 [Candidatus Saccharibacteria bacterium RIFCSPHIGHO2_02_FULL_46_12]|nr:MAG: hypothetical protein A3C39_04370 [Candidatus Saccharibacteria bacterium RIFCSPHIGHO2_02_FULL_46_12]